MIALRPILLMRVLSVVALLTGVCVPHTASAQQRVALVIGNSAYRSVSALPNPVNDAGDIGRALSGIGFDVTELDNADFDSMRRRFVEFGRRARGAEVALVFFAGHGMEIGGDNWLIPVDAELRTDTDAAAEAIDLRFVMGQVSGASKLGLIILDACRNNPFDRMQRTYPTRAVERGFSRVEPSTDNVAIVYASRDGTTAQDGQGRNSPFSAALLKHLAAPPRDVRLLFGGVRDDVVAATHGKQQPFIYQSLPGEEIYLRPPLTTSTPAVDPALQAWTTTQATNSIAVLEDFIRQFGTSPYGSMARTRLEELKKNQIAAVLPPELASPASKPTVFPWPTSLQDIPAAAITAPPTAMRPGPVQLSGHSGPISSIAYAADGGMLASGSEDKTIKLWDAMSGGLLRTLTGHLDPVNAIAFSPDGRTIASGSGTPDEPPKPSNGDNTIKLWDAKSGQLLRTFSGHRNAVKAVAFAPDGRTVASGAEDETVKIWDVASGHLLRTLNAHSDRVTSIAYSPDGATLASVTQGGSCTAIWLWDVKTGRVQRKLNGEDTKTPYYWCMAVAFTSDGRVLAKSNNSGPVELWNPKTGKLLRTLAGGAASIAFSPDGLTLAASTREGISFWNVNSGQLQGRFDQEITSSNYVHSIAFSPDGRSLASGSENGIVTRWNLSDARLLSAAP